MEEDSLVKENSYFSKNELTENIDKSFETRNQDNILKSSKKDFSFSNGFNERRFKIMKM